MTENDYKSSQNGSFVMQNAAPTNNMRTMTVLPDLEVTQAFITDEIDKYDSPWPSHIEVPLYMDINNVGNATASIVHIDILVDGRLIFEGYDMDPLEPGEGYEGVIPIAGSYIDAGTHTILVEVNRSRTLKESNYDNNIAGWKDGKWVDVVDLVAASTGMPNDCYAIEWVDLSIMYPYVDGDFHSSTITAHDKASLKYIYGK